MSQNTNTNPKNLQSVEQHAGGYTKPSLEAQGYIAENHPMYWLNVASRRKADREAALIARPAPKSDVERVFIHDDDRGYQALQLAATREKLAVAALDHTGVVMIPNEVANHQQQNL